jgi:hypothetical protein
MKKLLFSLVAILVLLISSLPISTNTAQAAISKSVSCQCVVYVKNKFHLSGSAGYARDMGKFLQARGFVRVSVPRPGDVIIMKKSFGHGITSAGHVALLQTVESSGNNWKIKIRGANQGGGVGKTPYWTESNCNNVNYWGGLSYPKGWGTSYVEYWHKR